MKTKMLVPVAFALGLVPLAACGDDGEGGAGNIEQYCELSQNTNDADGFPSDEEIAELRAAAPPELRGDIDVLAEAFREIDPEDEEAFLELFDDEAVVEALENVETFEAENC